ncbi:MAG: hypothetical protein ACK587_04805 [Cyanobacteriota bacterium]
MDTRRLVVWLSAGLLAFQGGTLVLDLIHCSVLSWLYVRRHGLEQVVPATGVEQRPPEGLAGMEGLGAGPQGSVAGGVEGQPFSLAPAQPESLAPAPAAGPSSASSRPASSAPQPTPPQPSPRSVPLDPTDVFCSRPRHRVDDSVQQGLTILAGLALGGSVGGVSKPEP